MKFLELCNKTLNGFSELSGKLVAWLCLVMMLVTALVAVMRYGFDAGSIAMQESITYLHAMVFMLGAAYTLKHEGHVRVDVFYRNFSARKKAVVDLAGTLLFLMPLCGYIFFSSLDFVGNSWAIRESSSEPGGIPAVFLLKTLIPLMAVLLMSQGLAMVCQNLLLLMGQPSTSNHIEASDD